MDAQRRSAHTAQDSRRRTLAPRPLPRLVISDLLMAQMARVPVTAAGERDRDDVESPAVVLAAGLAVDHESVNRDLADARRAVGRSTSQGDAVDTSG